MVSICVRLIQSGGTECITTQTRKSILHHTPSMQKRNASVVLMMSRRLLDSGWLLVLHFLAMVAPRDGVALKNASKKASFGQNSVGRL